MNDVLHDESGKTEEMHGLTRARHRGPRKGARLLLLAATGLSLSLGAAACGSSDTTTTTGTAATVAGSSSAGLSTSSCTKQARAAVAEHTAQVPLQVPPGSLDLAELSGKNVWLIKVVDNPFIDEMVDGFSAAAKAAGTKTTVFEGKGQVAQWSQGVTQATAQGAAAIVLLGIDPKNVLQAVTAAHKKGIPVIDGWGNEPVAADAPLAPGVYGRANITQTADGRAMADWTLADSNCAGNTLMLLAAGLAPNVAQSKGYVGETKRLCPKCKVDVISFDTNKQATVLGQTVSSELRKNPDIKYVVVALDGAVTYVAPAVKAAGGDVKILSHDGVNTNLDLVRSGEQAVDVAFPPATWMGWSLFDLAARGAAGMPAVPTSAPTRLIDKTNIGDSNAGLFPAYKDFAPAFEEAWHGN